MGTEIEVEDVLRLIADGADASTLLNYYPELSAKHIEACLRHTAKHYHQQFLELNQSCHSR